MPRRQRRVHTAGVRRRGDIEGDALAVLHAMWCALADNPASVGTHVSYFAFALIKAFQDHP